jgi:hypothetical protein
MESPLTEGRLYDVAFDQANSIQIVLLQCKGKAKTITTILNALDSTDLIHQRLNSPNLAVVLVRLFQENLEMLLKELLLAQSGLHIQQSFQVMREVGDV